MKKKVVVALGHKALGTTFPEQKTALKASVPILADLVEEGAQLIITHSNAPQVGMIHTAMNEYAKIHETYGAPMSVCSAMSQGYIGYDIQNALRSELLRRGIYKTVVTVLTQVTVDPYDEAFYHPVKVIGRYLTAEEAAAEEKKGNYVVEEPGKGFRRIVASPKPLDIVEIDAINALADAGHIVIAGGGGGIPVLKQGSSLKGASAVIEKDLVSGRLADLTDADMLMLLTNDEFVNIGCDTDHPTPLHQITPGEAMQHIQNNEFGKNKMLPKIEASVHFVTQKPGRQAIITSTEKAKDAYLGKTGTIIC
jgi:carbamate kinase